MEPGTHATGGDILLRVLADEGVRHIFGNPGTTELPLMDELVAHPEFEYVLSLQENSAVAMAEGYAQATGRPSFVNLHAAAGLGGGIGNLTNAYANGTPMVITAGQQDRRHLFGDPLLAGDLVGIARPVTKWQHEIRGVREIAPAIRRAFKDAASAPTGPVFISIPMDVLEEAGAVAVPARSQISRASVAGELGQCASLLAECAPGDVALVLADEVAASGSVELVRELADLLGCAVYGAPFYGRYVFPVDHPLWLGMAGTNAKETRGALSRYSRVFYIGGQVGFVFQYTDGSPMPVGTEVLHLTADATLLGRAYPARLGMLGDVRASLAELIPLVARLVDPGAAEQAIGARARSAADRSEKSTSTIRAHYDATPMHPMVALHALLASLPASGALVDEAVTSSRYLRGLHRPSGPETYFFCRGGGLGWAMPAALGVKLGRPEQDVLCVVGDGSAMYAVQSLYTAARYGLGVVFAVINNRQYRILREALAKSKGKSAQVGRYVAMDLDEPDIDYVALASSMGVSAARVTHPDDVTEAAKTAFESRKPWLLELPIEGLA